MVLHHPNDLDLDLDLGLDLDLNLDLDFFDSLTIGPMTFIYMTPRYLNDSTPSQ